MNNFVHRENLPVRTGYLQLCMKFFGSITVEYVTSFDPIIFFRYKNISVWRKWEEKWSRPSCWDGSRSHSSSLLPCVLSNKEKLWKCCWITRQNVAKVWPFIVTIYALWVLRCVTFCLPIHLSILLIKSCRPMYFLLYFHFGPSVYLCLPYLEILWWALCQCPAFLDSLIHIIILL